MEVSGIFPEGKKEVDMMKLAFIATDGERKTDKCLPNDCPTDRQMSVGTNAGEDVLKVFETAIKGKSIEPVRKYLIEKISQLAEVSYESENDGEKWLKKAEFMTWIETMKHLKLNTATLDKVEQDVEVKCGMKDIDKLKGAFMINKNLVMSAICDIMTVDQIKALLALCSKKKELEMVPFERNVEQLHFEAVGMKELAFFYTIRCMELNGKFNLTDRLLGYIDEIRNSVGHQEKLDQVREILERYEIRVQPAGYCLVFCMLENRKGAEEEINNIQEAFGELIGYKVKVVVNPNKKLIEGIVKEFSTVSFNSMFESLVCWVLAHGDTDNICLAGEEKLTRKDFLKLFSKAALFSKKPKLFFMAPCQGENIIRVEPNRDGIPVEADSAVKAPSIPDDDQDIGTVLAESDRLIAYATMPEHAAYRDVETGSIFVSIICEQIAALKKHPDSTIRVEDLLNRTARKMQTILFKDKETQSVGKQACYYETSLQKKFLLPNAQEQHEMNVLL